MYRTLALKTSRGNLRNAAAAQVPRIAPPLPSYSRNLVSSVLLSRDVYDKKNVPELKGELKQRGLSTGGKRKDLIQRLLDSDNQSAKVLPTTDAFKAPQQSRKASTKSATSKKEENVLPEASAGVVGGITETTIPHPPDMEPGTVSSNKQDASGHITEEKILEAHPTAPGVPPEKAARVPIVFDIKIPYEEIAQDKGPEIPLMTGYFHPENPMFKGPPGPEDGPVAHMPKVLTVSGEDTYHGGGPAHHHATFDGPDISRGESSASEQSVLPDEHTISSAIHSLFKTMRNDLGIPVDPAVEKKAKETTNKTLTSTRSLLKDARDSLAARLGSTSAGSGSGSASYSSYSGGNTRPLNDDETRGRKCDDMGALAVGPQGLM